MFCRAAMSDFKAAVLRLKGFGQSLLRLDSFHQHCRHFGIVLSPTDRGIRSVNGRSIPCAFSPIELKKWRRALHMTDIRLSELES